MSGLHKKLYSDFVWGLKYRPQTIEQLILPERIIKSLKSILGDSKIPNMMFTGPPGCGKTSSVSAIIEMMDLEYLYINTSEQTGIDVLRNDIRNFVTAVSWEGKNKLVIMDEFDRASPNLQDSFKCAIEEFSSGCNFIIISNHKEKIIKPLQSRLQSIDFRFTQKETNQLKKRFYTVALDILEKENVKYEKAVVAHIVNNLFPDMRHILNELQKFAQQDALTDVSVVRSIVADIEKYYKIIKARSFGKLNQYVAQLSGDPQLFYSQLYDSCTKYVQAETLPDFIILLGKYSYESAFVTDPRINIASFSLEVMRACQIEDIEAV